MTAGSTGAARDIDEQLSALLTDCLIEAALDNSATAAKIIEGFASTVLSCGALLPSDSAGGVEDAPLLARINMSQYRHRQNPNYF